MKFGNVIGGTKIKSFLFLVHVTAGVVWEFVFKEYAQEL